MTTATKIDVSVHRAANFNPADYEHLEYFYQGPVEEMYETFFAGEVDHWQRLADERGKESGHVCDHCGTRFHYGELYLHKPSDTIAVIGHNCASSYFQLSDRAEFQHRKLVMKVKAIAERKKLNKKLEAWAAENPKAVKHFEALEAGEWSHHIASDMHGKLLKYGSLSVKQTDFLAKLYSDHGAREARRAESEKEKANAADCPEGKQTICGTVLVTKWQESDYGGSLKMLVKDESGFTVWGSVPSSLRGCEMWNKVAKGDKIKFSATISPAGNDPKHGWFKRPTKAAFLALSIGTREGVLYRWMGENATHWKCGNCGEVWSRDEIRRQPDCELEALANALKRYIGPAHCLGCDSEKDSELCFGE